MSKVYLTQDSENALGDLAIEFKAAGANKRRMLTSVLSYFATSRMIPDWSREMPVGAIKRKISEDLFASCIASAVRKKAGEITPQAVVNSIIVHAGTLSGRREFRTSIRESLLLELNARDPKPPGLVLDLPTNILHKKQRQLGSKDLGSVVSKMLNESIGGMREARLVTLVSRLNGVPHGHRPDSHRLISVKKLDKHVMELLLKLKPMHDVVLKLFHHFNQSEK